MTKSFLTEDAPNYGLIIKVLFQTKTDIIDGSIPWLLEIVRLKHLRLLCASNCFIDCELVNDIEW